MHKSEYSALLGVDANVCKNSNCVNLGRSNSADYLAPTYYLGFPALHCNACGSNALLLNNHDINQLFLPELDIFQRGVLGACPTCYSQRKKRYGQTSQGTPRWQCRDCSYVFSDPYHFRRKRPQLRQLAEYLFSSQSFQQLIEKLAISYTDLYRLLKQLEMLTQLTALRLEQTFNGKVLYMASLTERLACYSAHRPVMLWSLLTGLSDSGYVLLINNNFTPDTLSEQSHYHWHFAPQQANYRPTTGGFANIMQTYQHFLQRKNFDQLSYTQSPVDYAKGTIIDPVITAYLHFNLLARYYQPAASYHFLPHEVMLRGACISAFSQSVVARQADLFYLDESTPYPEHLRSSAHRHAERLGWWKNEWYRFIDINDPERYRALGVLTHESTFTADKLLQLPATTKRLSAFSRTFFHYFPPHRLTQLSPSSIQSLLALFRHFYNYCQPDEEGITPAQRAGLVTKRLDFCDFIT